jgi:hypothetical protein
MSMLFFADCVNKIANQNFAPVAVVGCPSLNFERPVKKVERLELRVLRYGGCAAYSGQPAIPSN